MKYSELDKQVKHPRGTMECCKHDCKTKECFKNEYCFDYFLHNDLLKDELEKN